MRSLGAVGTPLPPIDAEQVAKFWERFLATGLVPAARPCRSPSNRSATASSWRTS